MGKNIFPEKAYGETYFNEHTNVYNNPRFIDVAVGAGGLVYVLEGYSSQVYAYDPEGNLLAVFGGEGKVEGPGSRRPKALDVNSAGDVFVLDGATGYIHRFARTDFMDNVAGAVAAYESGDYTGAYDKWNQVLRIDVNYPVANRGIAQALYKDGKMEEAMAYYELADSKDGYGEAFAEYRYQKFRAYFGWVVLAAAVLAVGIILLVWRLKAGADRVCAPGISAEVIAHERRLLRLGENSVAGKMLLIVFHPLDCMDIIKREKKQARLWVVPVLYLLAFLVNYAYIFLVHFPLESKNPADASLLLEAAMVIVPLFSWVVGSYLMTAITSGESTFLESLSPPPMRWCPILCSPP